MKIKALICSFLFLASTPLAFASLGGAPESPTLHTPGSLYQRNETMRHGARIHEFADTNGKVFAVAWQGKSHPDLKTLLGNYYPEFQKAYAEARLGHHHGGTVTVDSKNLHIEIGGRMMALHGRILVTNQVPNGVDLHEIK